MIVLGIILIVLGLLLPSLVPTFAYAHICLVIGIILLVVGLLLALMGRMGHAVGGRRHYY
jgi:low temperature requirement protein LtrA